MTIDKLDTEWAESGDTGTPPTTAKIQTGWFDERPKAERFNWLQARIEDKINRIIRERVDSYYTDATDAQAMITTGLWDDSWGLTDDDANVISGGSSKEYECLNVFFTSDNEPRLIIADMANDKFEVWNPRSFAAVLDTSDAWTDDLPSGGGETWEIISACTDGTSIYAMFVDTAAAPDEYHIQAWDITTWDVKTGWAATGTVLTGTGAMESTKVGRLLIFANSTHLAAGCPWTTVSASGDPAIQLIAISDGSITRDGAGDCPTGDSAQLTCLASDGTNIFFGAVGTVNNHICSATIADLTTGCGGTGYPDTITNPPFLMTSCGPRCIVAITYVANGSGAATDVVLRTLNSDYSVQEEFTRGQNSAAAAVNCEDWLFGEPIASIFDGINIWILSQIDTSSDDGLALIKIDVGKLPVYDNDMLAIQLYDIVSGVFYLPKEEIPQASSSTICFDGRDIWCNVETAASQTLSGKLFRLPMALLRS
jgi:hypothetical protein